MDSLTAALTEAASSDRRVLVYFTGQSCSWCRVMEQKTHADAAVIELASNFICVKVDVAESPGIQEDYGVFSIPQTLILTPENEIVTQCQGYERPTQHADRLLKAIVSPPIPPSQDKTGKIQVVGATEDAADVLFWFVDQSASDEAPELNHTELLSVLRDMEFRPRIEHLKRRDFKSRWTDAAATKCQPDILVAPKSAGCFEEAFAQ